ncbi:uncharacterized protein LOC120268534 [Dioscorea cayenensis subsp. rotundata]|uniref:Uncharacterized protein LOC120268534 n=1 Tax=Dioscorea cayennensis subsp. rotundata TaxID=55577 RepID=A0AB40BY69_DIOCR|nr:uncharacterized protein LOC120268534 [Dioscorea cayenensis subsp. rotundata]
MTLQLADRSVRRPRGVVKDVLVRVEKLIIPMDFVILDVDDDVDVPLILGRPFLNTSGALIDVKGGKMTFRVGDEQEVLALNPLDEYLEEFEINEVEAKVPSPPPTHKVAQMEASPPPHGQKKKTVKKVWRKANERLKRSVFVSTMPPKEVDRLYFESQGLEEAKLMKIWKSPIL